MNQEKRHHFTNRIVSSGNTKSTWFEYCPDTMDEVEWAMRKVISGQGEKNKDARIFSINQLIEKYSLTLELITHHTTDDDWLKAYIYLYQSNYIILAYTKTTVMRLNIFTVSARERNKNHVH